MLRPDHVRGFLESRGAEVDEKELNFIVARSPGLGGRHETTCVWLLPSDVLKARPREVVEEEYLQRFDGAARRYRGSRLHLLVESTEGMSSIFRRRAYDIGVKVSVPVQFYDMTFKAEVAAAAGTAVSALVNEAERQERTRVPQPYEIEGTAQRGDDVVAQLASEVDASRSAGEPRIWFLVAPAGQGKSIAFGSVFLKFYKRFQDRKAKHVQYPRPLPMLAAHIREAAGQNLRGLIDAFLQTDVAGHATRNQFDWLIDNGFATWMLDGLDEVITQDEEFLTSLEDRITRPNSVPQIVISVRDSLFRSSDSLRDFIDFSAPVIRVMRLLNWESEQKRLFAWSQVNNRLPQPSEGDSPPVRQLMEVFDRTPASRQLSGLPFYAALMVDAHRQGSTELLHDEVGLLELAVLRMCRREYQKGLSEQLLPMSALQEWLEELAVEAYDSSGVTLDALRVLAELLPALVTAELSAEQEHELTEQILKAPFLTRGAVTGRVEFVHEILGEFLASRRFVSELQRNPQRFLSRLSKRAWPQGSIMFEVVARGIKGRGQQLAQLALEEGLPPEGLRNLIQVLALADDGADLVKSCVGGREGAWLEGVRMSLNLDGINLRSCDLSSADLSGCSLRNAQLEGALLQRTLLPDGKQSQLRGASFGDCENFESVVVGGKLISDFKTFTAWVGEVTGAPKRAAGPCPVAVQLRHLFHKFVHMNGEGRRDSLPLRAVLRGRQVPGAPPVDECLERVIELGLLDRAEHHRVDRIARPRGTKYGEIVIFVKGGAASPDLRAALDSLCTIRGCRHGAH